MNISKSHFTSFRRWPLPCLALLCGSALAAGSQPLPPSAPGAATLTVTAVGSKASTMPEIKRDDLEVYNQKREKMQVQDWRREDRLYLAVLIDDSLDSTVANNWQDLGAFFADQPKSTSIGVFYARNGAAMPAQNFTQDHALARKALRLTVGSPAAFSSPYMAIQDLMKRWPVAQGRRSVIMISSGIDYYRGFLGLTSPDLDAAIDHAEKQNVNVWTIYWPDSGHIGHSNFRILNAQSALSRLSEETGAESYYLGSTPPVSLKPYFDEIAGHLRHQYLLTVPAAYAAKGRFERLHLATELPHVEFLIPARIYVPPAR